MKPKGLQKAVAAVWFGAGVLNGVSALSANNEAVRAEATAATLEAQGNPQAVEWQAYADGKEDDRNSSLLFAVTGLLGGTALGFLAADSTTSSRRREQEPRFDAS